MISVEQIRQKAERKYNEFLKSKIDAFFFEDEIPNQVWDDKFESFFPLEIKSDKGNTSDNLHERESDLKPLIQKSKNKIGKGYTLILDEVKTRTNGTQTKISKIRFETEEDYLFSIGRKKECERMMEALKIISKNLSETNGDFLREWAVHNLRSLTTDYSYENKFWENICLCVSWLDKNQGSGLYVREIPLPVHTKFIENNSVLIKNLTKKHDVKAGFEETFGLKGKSSLVHFRSLSKNIPMLFSKIDVSECVLRVEDFSSLDEDFLSKFKNVFIVENEMVYLTFPETPESICVWGQGYKVNVLGSVSWLGTKNLFYFGDLDEHGFDILSTYRRFFPDVKSFCMTEKVLDDYELFMVEGKNLDGGRIPENLSNNEKNVFMRIRGSEKNRLEQERISVEYISGLVKKYSKIKP